jgi:outer membrane protein assembly factor BamB
MVIYAVDRETATKKWAFKTSSPIVSSPTMIKDNICISSLDKYVYLLNPETGKVNKKFAADESIYSSPVVNEESIYFGSNDNFLYSIKQK